MNFETTRWMKNVMTGAENSIKRIDNHTLRSKHKLELVQMLGEMQTALEEEKADNTTITSMIDHLKSMQDILTSPTPEVKALTELSERINDGLQELDKINYIYAALQLDIVSITPLEEQIAQKKEELRQMFQGAVDIDLKQYGKISDVTGSALEAFHFVLIDNKIQSASDILPEQKPQEPPQQEQPSPEQESQKQPARSQKQRTENEKPAKYKKVFLKLPKVSPEELKELENSLFANGARYDKWKMDADESRDGKEHSGKKWYIWQTSDTDITPFKAYLPNPSDQPKKIEKPLDPPRYKMNKEGQMKRTWHGKLVEEMTEADLLRFMVETDLELYGSISPSMAEQLSESGYEYADGNIRSINPKQDVTTESILADSTMSPMKKAEQLINLAERDTDRLGPGERNMIVNYAYHTGNIQKTAELVNQLAKVQYEKQHGFPDQKIQARLEAENAAADRAKSAVQQNRQYLNIPKQPKDQFSNTIKYIKENGARFDQEKKAWYISGKADAEKFKDYLKGSLVDKIHRKHTEVHKADNAGDGKSQNEQLKTRSAKETER